MVWTIIGWIVFGLITTMSATTADMIATGRTPPRSGLVVVAVLGTLRPDGRDGRRLRRL